VRGSAAPTIASASTGTASTCCAHGSAQRPTRSGLGAAAMGDGGQHAPVLRRRIVARHHADNCVYALDNVCIHKQRELVRGVVLGDRIVCPGHQWAFHLSTGFEAKMERYQPTYPVRITDDGRVEVDVASPSVERPSIQDVNAVE
jgi:nitrite reductase/ring-hydroxylating ferredoxin subunit